MTQVLELAGTLVRADAAETLMYMLSEGADEDDEADDDDMRTFACEMFVELLDNPVLPKILLNVVCWTLGEYAYLIGEETLVGTLDKLCEVAERPNVETATRGFAVTAAMKISAQLGQLIPSAASLIDKFTSSVDVDIQQRCYEFKALAKNKAAFRDVLPVDASSEDVGEVTLDFLASYVDAARASGAREYAPPADNDDDDDEEGDEGSRNGLRFDAYEKPDMEAAYAASANGAGMFAGMNGGDGDRASPSAPDESSTKKKDPVLGGLNLSGVKSVWGEQGYAGASKEEEPKAQETPQPYSDRDPSGGRYRDSPPSNDDDNGNDDDDSEDEEARPREPTEKEKQAALLFGGLGNSGSSKAKSRAERFKSKKKKSRDKRPKDFAADQPRAAATPPPPSNVGDLLGGLDFSAPAQSATPPATSTVDLLGGLSLGGVESPAAPAAQPMAPEKVKPIFKGVPLNTQIFGQQWGIHSKEGKVQLKTSSATIRAVADLISSASGIHTVQILEKTAEAIFAGETTISGSLQSCLLHAKVIGAGAFRLTVRSKNSALTQRLISWFAESLK